MFLLLTIFVPSSLAQSTNTLPALAPAYGEIPPTLWERFSSIIIILGAVIIIIVAVIAWLIHCAEPPYLLPSKVLARLALLDLQAKPEDGNLLSAVSQNLRRYIMAAYSFPEREMTTTEFCAVLADDGQFGPDLAKAIGDFLRECDQRKFARNKSATPLKAAARALEFINQMEKRQMSLTTANETTPPPVKT